MASTRVEVLKDRSDTEDDRGAGKCQQFISYFAETTSFMGIPKIWASPRIIFKVMWTLFFLTAFVWMIVQLVGLFTTFYSFPIKTSVKLGFKPLPFPSITMCNMNPVKLSQAKHLECDLQKALELEDEAQSEECRASNISVNYEDYGETELVCEEDEFGEEICSDQPVTGLDRYYVRTNIIRELLSSEAYETRGEVGHSLADMLLTCNINGKTCDERDFTGFLSPDLGNCYTMHGGQVRVKKSGPESGLEMVLNLENEDFIRSYKTGFGLRVVVHENGTRPFPGSEGFTVSGGAETSIAMKLLYIERLAGLYGKCNDSKSFRDKFGVQYSEKACREFCQKNLIIDACKCQPDSEDLKADNTIRVCDKSEDFDCEDREYNKYVLNTEKGIDNCYCGSPCNEKVYETSISSRVWPIIEHAKSLEDQVCKRDAESPKCTYKNHTDDDIEIRKASFVKVKVYFQSLNFETIKEEPFYDTERFLSDIGGTMGLWIGASVLSLAEILEMFLQLIILCCCTRSQRRKK